MQSSVTSASFTASCADGNLCRGYCVETSAHKTPLPPIVLPNTRRGGAPLRCFSKVRSQKPDDLRYPYVKLYHLPCGSFLHSILLQHIYILRPLNRTTTCIARYTTDHNTIQQCPRIRSQLTTNPNLHSNGDRLTRMIVSMEVVHIKALVILHNLKYTGRMPKTRDIRHRAPGVYLISHLHPADSQANLAVIE